MADAPPKIISCSVQSAFANPISQTLASSFAKPVADGVVLIKGHRVCGYTNGEEAALELPHVVPLLIEDEFQYLGARDEKGPDWAPFKSKTASWSPDRTR